MAEETKETEKVTTATPVSKTAVVVTKNVRNRSGHRIELVINGKVVVFYPGKITQVPANFEVPNGLGLYVR